MTVLEMKREFCRVNGNYDLSDLNFDGHLLNDEELLMAYGIKGGDKMRFSKFKGGRVDIGEFDATHEGKAGSLALENECMASLNVS
jgi:hypothetical protein